MTTNSFVFSGTASFTVEQEFNSLDHLNSSSNYVVCLRVGVNEGEYPSVASMIIKPVAMVCENYPSESEKGKLSYVTPTDRFCYGLERRISRAEVTVVDDYKLHVRLIYSCGSRIVYSVERSTVIRKLRATITVNRVQVSSQNLDVTHLKGKHEALHAKFSTFRLKSAVV